MRLPFIVFALLFAAGTAWGKGPLPHYEVEAEVDQEAGALTAHVVMTLPPASLPDETIFVLGGTYRITLADASGGTVEVLPADAGDRLQRLRVKSTSPRGGMKVRLRYSGPLTPTGSPPLNVISDDLVELNLDSMWIPVVQGYTTSFTVDAAVRGIPPDFPVVAQGDVSRRGDVVRIRRKRGGFDLAFVAMRGLRRRAAGGLELYAADFESAAVRDFGKHGTGSIGFLERWFGRTPGRPLKVVVVRRPRESGYARRGYVVVTEGRKGTEVGLAKFIAHEFAHAWWAPADPTTEHRWLAESIAEYVALRYVEATFGVAARDEMLAGKRAAAAGAKPILGGTRGDAELYSKGPLLLFALEGRVGRASLDLVLKKLAADPPRVTTEFLAKLGEVAGRGAADEFEAALRK